MCVCVVVYNVCRMGEEVRASHCSALPRVEFPTAALAEATVRGSQKIRLRLFCLRTSNRIPIPWLLSLSILISNTINFHLKP